MPSGSSSAQISPWAASSGPARYPSCPLAHEEFGVVHEAVYSGGRKVAVKMMKEGAMSEDDFIAEALVMKWVPFAFGTSPGPPLWTFPLALPHPTLLPIPSSFLALTSISSLSDASL